MLFTIYYFLCASYHSKSHMENERKGQAEVDTRLGWTTSLPLYMYAHVSNAEWKTMLQSVFTIPVSHTITSLSGPHI